MWNFYKNHKLKKSKNKFAFTLAEVLTTLTIIGVIGSIIVPSLYGVTRKKMVTQQKNTFKARLEESLHFMQSKGDLSQKYDSTEDFIKVFQNYMNLTAVCEGDVSKCFADTISVKEEGNTIRTSTLSGSAELGAAFDSSVVGLTFANGVTALIAYDTNDCIISNRFDNTIDPTKCLAILYDINGKDGPNVFGEDIVPINIER